MTTDGLAMSFRTLRHALTALSLALALVGVSACASSADGNGTESSEDELILRPVTIYNWERHPLILQALRVADDIDAEMTANRLRIDTKEACADAPSGITFTKATDAVGKFHCLFTTAGSDDSAASASMYYDGKGVLRFVSAFRGNVNQGSTERRIYFNAAGDRIFEIVRTAGTDEAVGPFEAVDREHSAMRSPEESFFVSDPRQPEKSYEQPRCN
jgi:hypothetical protein